VIYSYYKTGFRDESVSSFDDDDDDEDEDDDDDDTMPFKYDK